jgi:hypothetical protein
MSFLVICLVALGLAFLPRITGLILVGAAWGWGWAVLAAVGIVLWWIFSAIFLQETR